MVLVFREVIVVEVPVIPEATRVDGPGITGEQVAMYMLYVTERLPIDDDQERSTLLAPAVAVRVGGIIGPIPDGVADTSRDTGLSPLALTAVTAR